MKAPDSKGDSAPHLHSREFGTGSPLIILHGLLGSSQNWQTIGKELSGDFRVFLVDQRNHGRSFHSAMHTYSLLAKDLLSFVELKGLNQIALIGHSMGGKVAMTFAHMFPEKVSRLIVVDIAPRAYPSFHDEIFTALNDMNVKTVSSRTAADQALSSRIPSQRVRQFVLTNLKRNEEGGFSWRMNLDALWRNRFELTKAVEFTVPCRIPALFIRGENSSYINQSDLKHISTIFSEAQFKTLLGAGHWVHADSPTEFIQAVREFLM